MTKSYELFRCAQAVDNIASSLPSQDFCLTPLADCGKKPGSPPKRLYFAIPD
jgi:hypothetical protein